MFFLVAGDSFPHPVFLLLLRLGVLPAIIVTPSIIDGFNLELQSSWSRSRSCTWSLNSRNCFHYFCFYRLHTNEWSQVNEWLLLVGMAIDVPFASPRPFLCWCAAVLSTLGVTWCCWSDVRCSCFCWCWWGCCCAFPKCAIRRPSLCASSRFHMRLMFTPVGRIKRIWKKFYFSDWKTFNRCVYRKSKKVQLFLWKKNIAYISALFVTLICLD